MTRNNKNKKPQVSFTLSPALPHGTSTHPPPLILTATALPPPTPTNKNNNKHPLNQLQVKIQ